MSKNLEEGTPATVKLMGQPAPVDSEEFSSLSIEVTYPGMNHEQVIGYWRPKVRKDGPLNATSFDKLNIHRK